MLHLTRPRWNRSGQVHAGTLFALTLAVLGGLIGAYLFKTYVMNVKPPPAAPAQIPPTYQLTVAAINIMDKSIISANAVKTINVSREDYDRVTSNPKYLRGNQPVGRTTLKAIKAEEPIYEDSLEPYAYPIEVSKLIGPGKRAVIVEVPNKQSMVRVGDHVDVLCTLSNDAFGTGKTATANIAKDLKVVARFNTTQTAARPDPKDTTHTFTLEASPYRAELIELAKALNATFALSVSARAPEGAGALRDVGLDDDPRVDRVTSADLAKIFGISPRVFPAPPASLEVERYKGVTKERSIVFVSPSVDVDGNPIPGRPAGQKVTPPAPFRPVPVGPNGDGLPLSTPGGTSRLPSTSQDPAFETGLSASDLNNGFRPPSTDKPGCKTCGKKKP